MNIKIFKGLLRANRSKSTKGESQTPLTITKETDDQSLEQPLNEADFASVQKEPDAKKKDDDWLNDGVPEASASAIKKDDDEWLNAGAKDVSMDDYKQKDDDWLNAGTDQPLEAVDESSLNRQSANPPEIQIRQDGPILNITVTTSPKQDTKPEKKQYYDWLDAKIIQPLETIHREFQIKQDSSFLDIVVTACEKQDLKSEQTVISLKINVSPQDLAGKGGAPYDTEITADGSSSSCQSLQDTINIKPVEGPVNQSHPLLDEINIRPVEKGVARSLALMDEVTVRPVGNPVIVSLQPVDSVYTIPVENRITECHPLMDALSIRPSPGPVNIEYELLDDLITKRAIHRTKKAKVVTDAGIAGPAESIAENAEPSGDAVITTSAEGLVEKSGAFSNAVISRPVERVAEKAKPVKTISVNEITEFLKEKRDIKQASVPSASVPSASTKERSVPVLAHMGDGMGNLSNQAKSLYKSAELRRSAIQVLAILRIYNKNVFYIQDANLTHEDTLMQEPQIKDFTFKVINTAAELDKLIRDGYNLVMNFSKIRRGLKKGMVVFLALVDKELASMGWACTTEESKTSFRGYPYNDDLDRQTCIVGDWTNPKYRDSGISSYVKNKRQELLKEKGFTFERSIVEESIAKDLHDVEEQNRLGLTYKRRTYANVSLPGILGVELWKEHPLTGTDTKPSYKMPTLLVLVWPSPLIKKIFTLSHQGPERINPDFKTG